MMKQELSDAADASGLTQFAIEYNLIDSHGC